MIDVTSSEFKNQVRSHFYNNNLVQSGIVHVVDEPLQNGCSHSRYQSWDTSKLDQPVTKSPEVKQASMAERIGNYIARQTAMCLLSTIQGVVAEWDDQVTLENSDHPIALIPSKLEKSLVTSHYLCPFTQNRIPVSNGKRLVRDDMCLKTTLFYPGEIKVFFKTPNVESLVDATDTDVFTYSWEYDVSVNGFEYVGPKNPTNFDVAKPESWRRTGGECRIVRVG
jgi:hypothetical protein